MKKPRRYEAMAELSRSSWTLEQIGEAFDLTRERVRQILSEGGKPELGGAALRSVSRQRIRAQSPKPDTQWDESAHRVYGCSRARAIELNDGLLLTRTGGKAAVYIRQLTNARSRHIAWEITFKEWLTVWMESGKWEQRGRTRDAYVMSRYGDTGPYKVGNVYITTQAGNASDSYDTVSAESRFVNSVREPRRDARGMTKREAAAWDLYSQAVPVSRIGEQLGIKPETAAGLVNRAKHALGLVGA